MRIARIYFSEEGKRATESDGENERLQNKNFGRVKYIWEELFALCSKKNSIIAVTTFVSIPYFISFIYCHVAVCVCCAVRCSASNLSKSIFKTCLHISWAIETNIWLAILTATLKMPRFSSSVCFISHSITYNNRSNKY